MLKAEMCSKNVIICCLPGEKSQCNVQMLNNGSVSWPVQTIFARQYLNVQETEIGLQKELFEVEGTIYPG
jgi:hypothetical protein